VPQRVQLPQARGGLEIHSRCARPICGRAGRRRPYDCEFEAALWCGPAVWLL